MDKDIIATIADKVKSRMDTRAKAAVTQLKPVFQAGDATSIRRSEWYQMIRDNWNDPEWRQRQGIQRDPVRFVQDSLEAHGLSSALLNQNKEVINLGLSQWKVDENNRYNEFMMQYGGPKPPVPIPQTPQSTPVEAQTPPPAQPIPVVPVQPQMPPVGPDGVPPQVPQITQDAPIQPPMQPPLPLQQPLPQLGPPNV